MFPPALTLEYGSGVLHVSRDAQGWKSAHPEGGWSGMILTPSPFFPRPPSNGAVWKAAPQIGQTFIWFKCQGSTLADTMICSVDTCGHPIVFLWFTCFCCCFKHTGRQELCYLLVGKHRILFATCGHPPKFFFGKPTK